MTDIAAMIYIRRLGADNRVKVTDEGVVWVERQRPHAPLVLIVAFLLLLTERRHFLPQLPQLSALCTSSVA